MTALDTGFGIAVDLCVRSVLGQDNLWPPACHTLKAHLAEAPCHLALDFAQKRWYPMLLRMIISVPSFVL